MVRKRLGDLLVDVGEITRDQLSEALNAKKDGQKLGDVLVERGFINEQQLIEVLEFQLGVPHVVLHRYPIDTSLIKLVPIEFAIRNVVIPIEKNQQELTVAMNDPMDYFVIDDLRLSTGFQIKPVIATKEEIIGAIHKYYHFNEHFEEEELSSIVPLNPEEAPAVKLVNQLFATGVQMKASDIHIDPQETKVIIRYRVDGVLKTERILSKSIYPSLIARIKVIGNLRITENRLPQDGRVKLTVQQRQVDLRISILPTINGEKVVIRILDLQNVKKNISEIGFNRMNLQSFVKLIEKPSGLLLITGPTGSGKTSTLYAGLHHLNSEAVNIVTIEDPVEYQLEGINQVQVNPQIGLDFSKGLRALLRQDPNIIMIGEIRDSETVEIAVRSALTGHLVLSTMHTNDSISTIPRLLDMNVEPYLVVSALSGVVAQRLVRKLCKDCTEPYEPTMMEKQLFEKRGLQVQTLYRGKGCSSCRQTGYKGRLAIHELFIIDDDIRHLLYNNQNMEEIKLAALKKGMLFLIDDGLLKAKSGLTTVDEILRVTLPD
ncbi:type II secretion system protein GspE [Heyndrickxia shackletonii]|uniref:Type II secretion system protein GspE n=1 Tax=Heyndrickxia shackletonii TaxID=157838 RepID=A0A0Q3THA3_9BACI|nr:ATPase, T2SS/T4P/T4SS family [Heyndrickxia shackletonii]KQL53392.1 type II secretion system protein GspE [Heyndrickxia shackletonii]NEY99960.1 Flp pilus assembly complex ATPase component [Heyndrickxia shackletonii]